MEIKGILKKVNATQERGENGKYISRKVWLTTEFASNYPQTIEIELNGDKVNLFDNIKIGSEVTCSINIKGREWINAKNEIVIFNTIQCWKVITNQVSNDNKATEDLPF
jgi:hypothetical protein